MNNSEGQIWYGLGLDNSELNKNAEKAQLAFKNIGNQAEAQGARIDNSMKKIALSLGGTAALGMLGKQILDTTAKFEKFGIVLKNTLGDIKGQDALDMISKFAATTPFQLDEVTGAFIKLTNQGFTPTFAEMTKLGDFASVTGKGFDQLGEAILDAQTGEFERLKEFGVKASQSGDKVTFTFRNQKTTVDKTNASIRGYILSLGDLKGVQGANALISASLTGQISNLSDKLAAMYNNIGKSNSGVLYAAVGGVTSLIDNYETLGKVIFGLVATYGAYQAGILVMTAANSLAASSAAGYTAVQMLQYKWLLMVEGAQGVLNKTMLTNPYVLATMAIIGLVSAMALYANSAKEARTEKELLDSIEKESQRNTSGEVAKLDTLKKILNDSNKSYGERKVALDKLKEIVPDYHASLTNEGKLINDNADALNTYVSKLIIAEKLKLAASKQLNAQEAFDNYAAENADVLKTATKKKFNGEELFAGEKGAMETWTKLATEAQNYGKVIEKLQSDLVAIDAKKVIEKPAETAAALKARLAKEAKEANTIAKLNDDILKQQKENDRKTEDLAFQKWQSQIDLEKDGSGKLLEQLELDHKKKLLALKRQEEDELVILQKEAQDKWQAKGGKGKAPKVELPQDTKNVYTGLAANEDLAYLQEQKKINDERLKAYQNFADERLLIDKTYSDKAIELESLRTSQNSLQTDKALEGNAKQWSEAVNSLNDTILKSLGLLDLYSGNGSDFMTSKIKEVLPLFTDISHATTGELNKVKDIISKIEFTPEQRQSLKDAGVDLDKLDKALAEIKKKGILEVDLKSWEGLLKIAEKLGNSIGQLGQSLSKMGGAVGEIGGSLSGLAGSIGDVTTAFSKTASTEDKVAAGVSGVVKLVTMVTDQIEANKKAQEEWNAQIEESAHLMAMAKIEALAYKEANIFGVENPYAKATAGMNTYVASMTNLQKLSSQIGGGQVKTGTKQVVSGENIGIGAGAGAAVGAAVGSIVPIIGTIIGGLIGGLIGAGIGAVTTKTVDVMENIKSKYGEIYNAKTMELNPAIIADYDKLDAATKKLVDNWKEIKAKTEEAQKQMQDNFKSLAGDLGKSLSDALVEAFANGDLNSAMTDFHKKVGDMIANILQQMIFAQAFQANFDKLGADMNASFGLNPDGSPMENKDGSVMTPEQLAALKNKNGGKLVDGTIDDDIEAFGNGLDKSFKLYDALSKSTDEELKKRGYANGLSGSASETARTATSKGFTSMSQNSADELNGRFTAMQGHTSSIVDSMKILQANSSQALKHLAGIETNTARLEAIENGMNSVSKSMDSVKSELISINTKGINIKV